VSELLVVVDSSLVDVVLGASRHQSGPRDGETVMGHLQKTKFTNFSMCVCVMGGGKVAGSKPELDTVTIF
jgi:hypothetical protein